MVNIFLSQFTNTITGFEWERVIRKIFFLWPIFVSLCFTSSVSMAEERPFSINFWPLFQYTSDPIEGTEEIEGLGPFFIWKKDPRQI